MKLLHWFLIIDIIFIVGHDASKNKGLLDSDVKSSTAFPGLIYKDLSKINTVIQAAVNAVPPEKSSRNINEGNEESEDIIRALQNTPPIRGMGTLDWFFQDVVQVPVDIMSDNAKKINAN
ncbi:uncharacterized protein LOC121738096 [Aricia agestis]|uniref:uncharacterized protein LOC121738096 n=1 Tax=Aricia agestis TaxID=91739 RepID=UPI001C20A1C4|nr:uncharacterized protein LOC121738096 [Aricia agestis]